MAFESASRFSDFQAEYEGSIPFTRSNFLGISCRRRGPFQQTALFSFTTSCRRCRLNDRLPILGKLVQEVAAELTMALGGTTPDAKSF
jgi:hypothetical protein